ncbi:hypothetical protein [Cohnella terricola]|uniref:Uncharacterized protein n=1 Tax=Cohnella terricola TaxID=1289167 RepID=A0A559JQ21_9BACL|nr:hypothetical protein [Cohnella terricola]TVY01967.1 hypothetical protein FPZ45_05850 [Cohnella terricola]
MNREQRGNEVLDLLEAMPRRPLDPGKEEDILYTLRHMSTSSERRNGILLAKIVGGILAVGAVFLCLVLLLPVISNTEGISRWFSAATPPLYSGEDAEISPIFDLVDKEGRIVYPDRLIGIKSKIAFTFDQRGFIAKSTDTVSKIFWVVWGDPAELRGASLVAKGTNLDTGETFTVNESKLGGPYYGYDASVVTAFNSFPSKGKWRIDVELNGKLYGTIVVPVKAEYIHTERYRFMISEDDALTGNNETTLIVPGHDQPDTLDVIAQLKDSSGQASRSTFRKTGDFIQSSTLEPVTEYSGTLRFDRPGRWQIELMGEKTSIEVK